MMLHETSPRVEKQWWAVFNYDVHEVTGYSCSPESPKTWWCSEVGYPLLEDYHLFPTEKLAIERLIANIEKEIHGLNGKLEALRIRLKIIRDTP